MNKKPILIHAVNKIANLRIRKKSLEQSIQSQNDQHLK